jgi:hypothetical protein
MNISQTNVSPGIYSYFLAVRADRNQGIPTWQKAVEGISGVAVLYTIAAVVLTCCLGGISFFAITAIILDILFVGGFIAIAVLTRRGAQSCTGTRKALDRMDSAPDRARTSPTLYLPALPAA